MAEVRQVETSSVDWLSEPVWLKSKAKAWPVGAGCVPLPWVARRWQQLVICTGTHLGTPPPLGQPEKPLDFASFSSYSRRGSPLPTDGQHFQYRSMVLLLSAPPLAFVLFITWIYMGERRLKPKAFKIGRDEKNCCSLRLVGAFCSLDALVLVLCGSFSAPVIVHHILLKIVITSLMWI